MEVSAEGKYKGGRRVYQERRVTILFYLFNFFLRVVILVSVARKGLFEKLTSESRLEGGEK